MKETAFNDNEAQADTLFRVRVAVVLLAFDRKRMWVRLTTNQMGRPALPQGEIRHGENPRDAARRILKEITGITSRRLAVTGTYTDPADVLTLGYVSLGEEEQYAIPGHYAPLVGRNDNEVLEIHNLDAADRKILDDALTEYKRILKKAIPVTKRNFDADIIRTVFGTKFTVGDIRLLMQWVWAGEYQIDPSNFTRRLQDCDLFTSDFSDEPVEPLISRPDGKKGVGRPSRRVYKFRELAD